MASTKTQISEWYVDALTTTPVILGNHVVGKDYYLKRVKVTGTNCKIGLMVNFEANDLDEVDVAASNGVAFAIIPDTPFNRRQISISNTTAAVADWSYALVFADTTVIDIAIPINNITVRMEIAASNAVTPNDTLECVGGGLGGLQAASGVAIGKPLAITTAGTGTQIIAAVLFASQTNALHA